MTGKGQMALAVGAGYMLGRTHKMKLALMLAGAGASSRFPSGSLGVLGQGGRLLANSPEVAKLGETVRKELMNAAKTAAVTAASRRIDSLNSRLQSGGDETPDGKRSNRRRREEPEDDYDDEEYAEVEEEPDADEDEGSEEEAPRARKRPAPRRRSSSSGGSRPTRSRSSTKKDDEDETPTRVRKSRAKATTDVIPIRRTRK
ncbi:hypothetical protein CJ179_33110 [Rhodococcus sp. ACS1]|uniref:Uncharacterized protein n=1 Tax=Rhodococcus koreensis TaxID=99653 RepID=A0A1H4IBJ5_9NOCA|nr:MULTISPECIES: hypothetical protein [Rhodococcus]PBC39978.1 hypothetical protein CJ179_33110 [Rhodococcus sp. ACS1]SEB31437.1 hypothetical protein SAMN04490239_0358 [Rhodococcus koreensis]